MKKPSPRHDKVRLENARLQEINDMQGREILKLSARITELYNEKLVLNNKANAYLELANRRSLQLENTIDRKVRKFFRILFNLEQR